MRSLEETTRPVQLHKEGDAKEVVIHRSTGTSSIEQRIRLSPGEESLRITTTINWNEENKLLKLGFPLDVRADRSAAETQFGHIFRPTHVNTSWEAAKFEVCAHRWIHVGEPDYGIAISNDAIYGHDVTRTIRADGGTTTSVRLSMLRAPRYPDPTTDQGLHTFTINIRPGATIANAVEEGYRTNLRPRFVHGAGPVEPLFTVSNPGIVVEAVKLAEDRSGDVIVRLYESLGKRTSGSLTPAFNARRACATDLLEREIPSDPAVDTTGTTVQLTLRPFQLVTLRFDRKT